MKTKKITKGEWYAKDGNVISMETGKTLAIIPYYDKDNEEEIANTNVMAAAPEMLDILMFIDDATIRGMTIEKGSSLHRDIMNAINKATE